MNKKGKIWIAILLVLVMLLTVACSGGDGEIKQPSDVQGDSSVIPDDGGTDNDAALTIPETVLYDAGGVKVTVTGYEDGWMGPEVKVLVENNTAGNVLVTADAVSVNGYMMPFASLYTEVAAGKKANDSLVLSNSGLEQSGIEVLAEIQFYLDIQNADNWDTIDTSDLLTLTTSAAPYDQNVDDSGDVLYDEGGIRIICKGLKQDIIWDGTVVFYLENNTGRNISVYAENVSVNGFMQTVGLWSDLRPGTRLIDGMSMIDLSDLAIESIDQIENIEFDLRVIDADTWDDIVTTDVMTLNFG